MTAPVDVGERLAQARAGDGGTKVPYPIGVRTLEVLRTTTLNPSLLRLTLGGPELAGFQSHAPEEHVRLIFPDADGQLRLPERNGKMLRWPRPLPPSREYTVRRHDPVAGELDIDVVAHAGGLASEWAARVAPGTPVPVAGPPGGFVIPDRYDHYLFAGDITALPQIARYLERLPATATGWAFLEVRDATEELALTGPAGVEVTWVHRGARPAGHGDVLERAVRSVSVPAGERVFVWVAGEAGALRPIRRYVAQELGVDSRDARLTGYWKLGVADFDDEE